MRNHALATQRAELGNLEGAAAFAVLAPRAHRAQMVRATVAFQIIYDYVDSLAEQPCENQVANGYQLHLALLATLGGEAIHTDYYLYSPADSDNGYISELTATCREALDTLPSYAAVAEAALHAVQRMIVYQSLNHSPDTDDGGRGELARWARSVTPIGTDLRWWETAAATASSLGVFALFAAACRPALAGSETAAVERAYFPWIGALHVLLDSLVDRTLDAESGHHSLVEHYSSDEEAAARMSAIAARALRATDAVPQAAQHALILAAMTSFYLSAPGGRTPSARPVSQQLLQAMGVLARPTMTVLRVRHYAERRTPKRAHAAPPKVTRDSSIGLSPCRRFASPTSSFVRDPGSKR